jgi:hypothetical protein
MPGLFLSYRRSDAGAWAGRLFDHLTARFESPQVFMDIEGGIPRGADFARNLTNALATCDVLLALMGPDWLLCTGADGQRRLDVPEDWVRNEVATALRRGIPVVPVLLGGARLPKETELPEELRRLVAYQAAEVRDARWRDDVGVLVADLLKLAPFQLLDDVAAASTGLRLLQDLSSRVPAVAEAVSSSREVIANTYNQAGKLETFKTLHDELHFIEFECLRPIQAGGAASRLRPFKLNFARAERRIQEALQARAVAPLVQEELLEQLEQVNADFQAAVTSPDEAARASLLGSLNVLLTRLSPRLEQGISEAARELSLDRLVELMDRVTQKLPETSHRELKPFMQSVDALHRLRVELAGRVDDHHRLQALDSKLRTVCVGGATAATVSAEWERIKKVRSRLPVTPVTPELSGAMGDLGAIEAELNAAVGRNEQLGALDLLQEYFRAVSSVFRDVDGGLKGFCLRLGEVRQPLETVLELCRAPAA